MCHAQTMQNHALDATSASLLLDGLAHPQWFLDSCWIAAGSTAGCAEGSMLVRGYTIMTAYYQNLQYGTDVQRTDDNDETDARQTD